MDNSRDRTPETTVDVTMGGKQYRLRGSDPDGLRTLAAEVDLALAEVAPRPGPIEDLKVAVLAALNIAGDRQAERRAAVEKAQGMLGRLRDLERRLDRLKQQVDTRTPAT